MQHLLDCLQKRNPAKKEEGCMLKHGMANPAMAATHPTGTWAVQVVPAVNRNDTE